MVSKSIINGIEVLTIENEHLICSVVPALGGKIISLYNKKLQKEFLWSNQKLPLQKNESGADYDSNFWGGIDELLPNDLPENIDGINYPDHGELWTTALQYSQNDDMITVFGNLELSGLFYSKTLYIDADNVLVHLDYSIQNMSDAPRHILWKLHAALQIEKGDKLITNASYGQIVDPVYSRFTDINPFQWPFIEGKNASVVPPKSNAVDFFYLCDVPDGIMKLISSDEQSEFSYQYDTKVFPYQWYFASYGGLLDHYTAILEPCTNMPLSVNEAKEKQQCAVLKPGESIKTKVTIYAGEKRSD